ncbi:uncharacterized protein LOC130808650 [Amaranthus tricolor]|uniref:uncharacterized protein LOC130808650 n=1 Tax=Amaranthus tricolor TaxID=29722 RepID=UPI00258C51BA|nr:uncharacterized protein LOC130808650 [Amaranthus tricolor]
MPTLSAIQLDRYLESNTTSSNLNNNNKKIPDVVSSSPNLDRRNTASYDLKSSYSRGKDIPPPHPQLRRGNSTSSSSARVHIHPALYTTPEPTPIPDSPTSSFPPSSPYLINHKRRGPRLLKSLSDQNVAAAVAESDGHKRSLSEENVAGERGEEVVDMKSNDEVLRNEIEIEEAGVVNGEGMRENGESEDFYDPQESLSFSSAVDSEEFGGDKSASGKANTPMGEFFDAWEELSSDSGIQAQRSLNDAETELREMRLSLLMEIEKRKQAEETLQSMQQQWQMLREKLGAVGLRLPADFTALIEDSQSDFDPADDICRQIELTRFVSESIGRGIAKAEAEAEMEAQLEVKSFEITRLCDRLHYYETMNQEMSQRNQETIEIARRERQKKRRRQKWVWGALGSAAIVLGTALAWSYLPSEKGSSLNNNSDASKTVGHKK